MLFQNQKSKPTSLPQPTREAIVDLLHLCLFADAHISLKEGNFIADVVNVIGWDTNLSFSSYESRSIAAAREARSDEKSKLEFLKYAAQRIDSPASKDLALSLCKDLFSSDGTQEKESTLLSQIRAVLKS